MWDDGSTWLGHGVSITALVGAVTGLVTPVAAVITTCWFAVQLYESRTVQDIVKRRRARKILRLKIRLNELERSNTTADVTD